MKPLVRWTVGPVTGIGIDILKESVRLFGRLYPEFDRIVCYNNMQSPNIEGVEVKGQSEAAADWPLTGPDADPGEGGSPASGWKLCPARLRPDAYELWLDNDIVITRRMPEIDIWLSSRSGIISEGLHRLYGVFEPEVSGNKLCAGMFGLPPGFDFGESIMSACRRRLNGLTLGHYDEQGLVAATVTGMAGWVIVPLTSLAIVEDHHPFPDSNPAAFHFVGANRKEWHRGWKCYKSRMVKMI